MADIHEQIALDVLRRHFAIVMPESVMRSAIAREMFLSNHGDLLEEYGIGLYTQAIENLISSPYFDPRRTDHLERECQRLRLQAPSTPDTYEETGGDTMPWDK